MRIQCRTLLNHKFEFDLDESLPIIKIKEKVNQEGGEDYDLNNMVLVHSGRRIENHEIIKDCYYPENGEIVVLLVREIPHIFSAGDKTPPPEPATTVPVPTVDNLARMMEMGYNKDDCIEALEACSHDIESATEFIELKKRSLEEAEAAAAGTSSRATNNEPSSSSSPPASSSSRTPNNLVVESPSLRAMLDMGFNRELSIKALDQSADDISRAIQLIDEGLIVSSDDNAAKERAVNNIMSMGFSHEKALRAMNACDGNAEAAVCLLIDEKST